MPQSRETASLTAALEVLLARHTHDCHCCRAVKVSCGNSSPCSGNVDLSRFRDVRNAKKES
jgi:hypothetical protein